MDEQLFAKPAAALPPGQQSPMPGQTLGLTQNLGSQITSIATRLKLAEERYANLNKRNQLTEESLLAFERDMKSELKVLTKQTMDLRKHLSEMGTKIDAMTGELSSVVQKHEFATLERYIDLWQPMQFVTREEARRIIADAKQDFIDQQANSNDSTAVHTSNPTIGPTNDPGINLKGGKNA